MDTQLSQAVALLREYLKGAQESPRWLMAAAPCLTKLPNSSEIARSSAAVKGTLGHTEGIAALGGGGRARFPELLMKKYSMVDIRPWRKIDACERSRAGRPMHVKDLEREDQCM